MGKVATPKVSNIVVSMVWVQVLPDLFKDGGAKGVLAPLVAQPTYAPVFDGAGAAPNVFDARFSFPWAYPVGQHFWMRYLHRGTMSKLKGPDAWSALVPIRERLGPVTADNANALVIAEAFYYPFGIGLMFTVRIRRSIDLAASVDELYRLTHVTSYSLPIDGTVVAGRPAQLAPDVFALLQSSRFGNDGEVVAPLVDAFSVCTVVQADEEAASQAPLNPAGPIAPALHGLASWSPTWRKDPPAKPSDYLEQEPGSPASGLIYLAHRGRAVWLPELFAPEMEARHSLSCYHRNLAFASLTADALSSLLMQTNMRLGPGGSLFDLTQDNRDCVQNGAARLSALYLGSPFTYKSKTVRLQIDASAGHDAYNSLADRLPAAKLP
jgi:hypothetical protein